MLYHAKLEPEQLKPSAWVDGSAGQVLGKVMQLPLLFVRPTSKYKTAHLQDVAGRATCSR